MIFGKTQRPRNVDSARAAAILYGDWGTSKAYVRYFAQQHEARDGRPGRVGAGATCQNHQRRSRVSGRAKTRAGGIDDFCAAGLILTLTWFPPHAPFRDPGLRRRMLLMNRISFGNIQNPMGRPILPSSRRPAVWLRPRAKVRSSRFCRPAPSALPASGPCPGRDFWSGRKALNCWESVLRPTLS